jgi:hypothetical protein
LELEYNAEECTDVSEAHFASVFTNELEAKQEASETQATSKNANGLQGVTLQKTVIVAIAAACVNVTLHL